MKIISLTAENVKKIRAVPPKLPPPQALYLECVSRGIVRYAHHSGGLVTIPDGFRMINGKRVLLALSRKGLVKLPPRSTVAGLVTITAAGRKALEQVDTTGRVGIVMEDGLATVAGAAT